MWRDGENTKRGEKETVERYGEMERNKLLWRERNYCGEMERAQNAVEKETVVENLKRKETQNVVERWRETNCCREKETVVERF